MTCVIGTKAMASSLSGEKLAATAAPAIVIIPSAATAEDLIAGLKADSSAPSIEGTSPEQVDASDLTREQWMKVL